MDKNDYILDDEQLYRSVRGTVEDGEYFYNEAGELIIREVAFRDRNKKPSVDRAKLRGFDPSLSKLSVIPFWLPDASILW